jgi:hypothetical protein
MKAISKSTSLILALLTGAVHAATAVFTTFSNGIAPARVISMTVEAWGCGAEASGY